MKRDKEHLATDVRFWPPKVLKSTEDAHISLVKGYASRPERAS
jgi:hypothetical protein